MPSRKGAYSSQLALVVAVVEVRFGGEQRTLKVREILLGDMDCLGIVVHQHVYHPVFGLEVHRPDLLR